MSFVFSFHSPLPQTDLFVISICIPLWSKFPCMTCFTLYAFAFILLHRAWSILVVLVQLMCVYALIWVVFVPYVCELIFDF